MKPRHTAEQSTVAVNKAQKIGKTGFAAVAEKLKIAEAPQTAGFAAPLQKTLMPDSTVPTLSETKETKIPEITSQSIPSPISTPVSFAAPTPVSVEKLEIPSVVAQSTNPTKMTTKEIVGKDGVTYKLHAPEDPGEANICIGCE
jgi:hypothetical protein